MKTNGKRYTENVENQAKEINNLSVAEKATL